MDSEARTDGFAEPGNTQTKGAAAHRVHVIILHCVGGHQHTRALQTCGGSDAEKARHCLMKPCHVPTGPAGSLSRERALLLALQHRRPHQSGDGAAQSALTRNGGQQAQLVFGLH